MGDSFLMIWFTADTHFGHANIIPAADRPFSSIDRMNSQLIANINDRVSTTDTLYVLGDFSYRITVEQAYALRRRINCRKVILVRGNHDKGWGEPGHPPAFSEVLDYAELKPGMCHGQRMCMLHYPMLSWNGKWRLAIHLHGHIHAKPEYNQRNRDAGILRYDVGVDANNYCPVSRDDILAFFKGVDPVPDSDRERRLMERGE